MNDWAQHTLEFLSSYSEYIFIWLCGSLVKTITEVPFTFKRLLANLITSALLVFTLIAFLDEKQSKQQVIMITFFFVLVSNNIVAIILNLGKQFQQNPEILAKWLLQFLKK